MSKVIIDLKALKHNLSVIEEWMKGRGSQWSVVTKVLCGHADTLKALQMLGVRSIGDSRLENLRAIEHCISGFEAWYLRLPHLSAAGDVVQLADVSLNSEISIIHALNDEARRRNREHHIIIMIELGDLREGILPGHLVEFYRKVFELDCIDVLGIGANLGCLAGAVPNIDQFMQLVLYRELLELKFGRKLPLISAGSSAVLPLVLEEKLPKAINHFRIGESIFLGSDLVNGGTLPGLRDDVILLQAEIAEIKEKSLLPMGETSNIQPFETAQIEDEYTPGQRGYRALVTIGQLDTDVHGLQPCNPEYKIAGASSDISVINLGDNPMNLRVGDEITFRVNYSALLRLMYGRYIEKETRPSLEEFSIFIGEDTHDIEPVTHNITAIHQGA